MFFFCKLYNLRNYFSQNNHATIHFARTEQNKSRFQVEQGDKDVLLSCYRFHLKKEFETVWIDKEIKSFSFRLHLFINCSSKCSGLQK